MQAKKSDPVYVIVDTPTAQLFRLIFFGVVGLSLWFFAMCFVSVLSGALDYKNPYSERVVRAFTEDRPMPTAADPNPTPRIMGEPLPPRGIPGQDRPYDHSGDYWDYLGQLHHDGRIVDQLRAAAERAARVDQLYAAAERIAAERSARVDQR
jgi:hypothetical protein